MDTQFSLAGTGILFAEDFDGPGEPALEPSADAGSEPTPDAALSEAEKAEAYASGFAAGKASQAASDAAAACRAIAALVDAFDAARTELHAFHEQTAEGMARGLLTALGAVMPALSASHGDREAAALTRSVLAGLAGEPSIAIRAEPHTGSAVMETITRTDPGLLEHVHLIPTDAMVRGDITMVWRHGRASRDAASLWREIAAVLLPYGLLAEPETVHAEEAGSVAA